MADYNIYIHSYGSGGNAGSGEQSPTRPWANQPGFGGDSIFKNIEQGVKEAQDVVSNGFSSMINTGVAALSKAVPWVAIVMLALKITDSVISTGFNHVEQHLGQYQWSMGYNNFKTGVKMIVNPFGYFYNLNHAQQEYKIQNLKIEENRKLIGNSILNTSVKGV